MKFVTPRFDIHSMSPYSIKAYSPFHSSLTYFFWTLGVYLVSFSFVINIINSLHSDFM